MKKCVPLLLLLVLGQTFAQSLESSRRSSYYRYIFRITNEEAQTIYRKGMDQVAESYFHTVVDSFPSGQPYSRDLPVGHYLLAHAEADHLVYELQSVNHLQVKLLNNKTDLTIHLHDSLGRNIPDARVALKGRHIPYHAPTASYLLRKTSRHGLLAITYRGFTSYHSLEAQYKTTRLRKVFYRIIYRFPLRYAWQPFRDIYRSLRYGQPTGMVQSTSTLFDPDRREDRFENRHRGFMVFNKPRYQPGDTVKLKAVVLKRKGKPVNREVTLRLYGNGKFTTLTTLEPYRRGAYAYQFLLHDSLKLTLDTHYQLYLDNRKGNTYLHDDFKYEDYELESNTFKVRSGQKEHYPGQTQSLFLKGTDENDLNLLDARVELTVLPQRVFRMQPDRVFVPDTLWQHQQTLDPLGETKITLPDSIFPKASLEYSVEAVFLNASNERHAERLIFRYYHQDRQLKLELKNDTLTASLLEGGKMVSQMGQLTAYGENDDTLFSQSVRLPFVQRINPYADYYELAADSLYQTLELSAENSLVQCLTSRTEDSVLVQVQNPRKIPFWYTIYRQNTRITGGYGDSLLFQTRESSARKYFVSLQYVWQGKVREEEYEVPFANRKLQIQVDHPVVVYPGQKTKIGIAVTDARGNPVADADVTAYGVTKKFPEAGPPTVPDFSRQYRSRKLYNTFHFKKSFTQDPVEDSLKLNYPVWKAKFGLDSLAYYHFLYPKNGLYQYALPLKDSLTQLAPFVVQNGKILAVNMVWVDHLPVYIRTGSSGERYTFPVDSGYHSVTLRTSIHRIELDSVYLPHAQKLILSTDTRIFHRHKRVDSLAARLTSRELNMLSYYLMPYRNTFGNHYAYLKQGRRIFPLSPLGYSGAAVGPVYPWPVQAIQLGGWQTDFAFEPLFEYDFQPNLLKMRSREPFKYYTFPSVGRIHPRFGELAWTERELDSLWRTSQEASISKREFYNNPAFTSAGHGRLFLFDRQYPEQTVRGPKRVLLFKEDDPDFIRVYSGTAQQLNELGPGNYKVMLLLFGNYYLERGGIRVEKDGTTYIRMKTDAVKPPDAKSKRLDSLVTSMITRTDFTWQEQQENLQNIKETYNQTYNVLHTGQQRMADFYHLVRGVVKDDTGTPLPGVSVLVKGTTRGTVTNAFGEYSFYTPPNGVLVFSFIGYEMQEILINGRGEVNAKLLPDIKALSEVVVVGYGTQQRKDITGSIATVQQTLQGRVAGISITGMPGAGIMIRGNRSANVSQPLYIVDGVIFEGNPADLDPAFLSSAETLSGATATALYGNRGINGVIIITTRKQNNLLQNQASLPPVPGEGAASTASLRNRFSDYAYWQPRLRTDRAGKTSFEVTFPDDITNWRTFVAAFGSKKRTGVAESQVKAFKTLSGNLALPRFLVEGDSADAVGKVLNYTVDTIPVTRAFAVNDQVVFSRPGQVVHSLIDTLRLTAPATDSLKVKYYVQKADGYLDGEMRTLPVFAKGVSETKGQFLHLAQDTTLTLRFDPKLGKVKLYAQADVLQILLDEIDHVRRYEYLCNEQMASKLKALLAEKKIRSYLGQQFKHEELVKRLVRKLTDAQQKSGTWGWWPDAPFSAWISAHVAEALVQAANSGYPARFSS